MHVISSPVLRGMKSIDQVKLFLTLCEALTDSSVVVVITDHLNVLLPFSFSAHLILLFFFICKDFHALLVFLIWLIHIFDYQTICTSRKLKCSAPVFVWVCVPMYIWMPCVQLHKYVFCFLGATNKALKEIQSTYLNNCSLTRACTHTHTNAYITHSDRATLNNMHTNPVLASPLLLHSREQMFGDSLQPQRISVYKANSSTQHFWLQREICSWGRGGALSQRKVSWGWVEREKRVRRGAYRGETVSRLQVCCIGKFPVSWDIWCVGTVWDSIMDSTYSISLWHHAASVKSTKVALLHIWLCGVPVTSPMQLCLLTSLDCPFKSCRHA